MHHVNLLRFGVPTPPNTVPCAFQHPRSPSPKTPHNHQNRPVTAPYPYTHLNPRVRPLRTPINLAIESAQVPERPASPASETPHHSIQTNPKKLEGSGR
eukprot:2884827-Prymnesium_polylepis.1